MSVSIGQARALVFLVIVGLLALGAVLLASPAQGHEETQVQQAGGGVVISAVSLTGDDATVEITNTGDTTVNLDGWFVCNFPAYWGIPAVEIAPGASLTFHAGAGTDTATDLFAGGAFGSLDGSGAGEVALYSGSNFTSSELMQSYVAWNGGGLRKGVAQAAGIWGDTDITAEAGALLDNSLDGTGAEAWFVALPGQEPIEEPEPIAAMGYGAELSGDNEVPAVDSDARGSFVIDVDPDTGVASWSIWLANVQDITQAHIHMGAADANAGVIAFFFDPDDPGFSSPTSVHFEGSFTVDDLIGALAEDWAGFDTALDDGNLYVNVHSVANPGGEIRGQIEMIDPSAPTIGVPVAEGSSLFGWFGASVTSADLIEQYDAISAIWYLGAVDGWILDSRDLPTFLRVDIAIDLGTGILIIASANFTLEVPLT